MNVEPKDILAGLAHADRQTLCTFLALYQDSNLPALLWDTCKDAIKNYAPRGIIIHIVADYATSTSQKAFSERIVSTSKTLEDSGDSDDTLRLRLWMHLRAGFALKPALTFSSRGAPEITEDLAAIVCETFAKQLDDKSVKDISLFSKEYWSEHANRRLNPFSGDRWPIPKFPDVVKQNVIQMIAGAAARDELPEELKSELIQKIREAVASVDPNTQEKILNDLGVETLTDDAALKLLLGGGGLVGIGIAVEMAGFAAYIMAAQASAIIPYVGGQTLVSTLAVVANPMFIIPMILGGGLYTSADIRSKICRAFGVASSSLLALKAIAEGKTNCRPMIDIFNALPKHLPRKIVVAEEKRMADKTEPVLWERASKHTITAKNWLHRKTIGQDYPDAVEYLARYYQLYRGSSGG